MHESYKALMTSVKTSLVDESEVLSIVLFSSTLLANVNRKALSLFQLISLQRCSKLKELVFHQSKMSTGWEDFALRLFLVVYGCVCVCLWVRVCRHATQSHHRTFTSSFWTDSCMVQEK